MVEIHPICPHQARNLWVIHETPPRVQQSLDLYMKIYRQNSEISKLLGECESNSAACPTASTSRGQNLFSDQVQAMFTPIEAFPVDCQSVAPTNSRKCKTADHETRPACP